MLHSWILKAVIQKSISFLPGSRSINFFFQKHISKGGNLPLSDFIDRLKHLKKHIENAEKYGVISKNEMQVLELGTGWHPIIPIGLYLSGFGKIITIDIIKHYKKETIKRTLESFIDLHEAGLLSQYFSYSVKRISRLDNFLELDVQTIFSEMNINGIIGNPDSLSHLKESIIDMVVSNNTIQHIPLELIFPIFKEFGRLSKKGTVHSHFIDMTDQFSHKDTNISNLNFLKFSRSEWKYISNDFNRTNRERIGFYRDCFAKCGIHIIEEEDHKIPAEYLRKVKIHKDFAGIPETDLQIIHSHITGIYK